MRIRRWYRQKGTALFVVFALGLISIAAFAVAQLPSRAMVVVGERVFSETKANDAGRAVIHDALHQFKTGNFAFEDDLTYEFEGNGANSTLTFDSSSGLPYSTNNFSESSAVTGWNNTLVPPNSAHLVSQAHQGAVSRTVEMIITHDSFPWSVASNGSIVGNDMEVFAINSTQLALDGITEDEKKDADILSNFSGGGSSSDAIFLTGNSLITGDATAVGDIQVVTPSEVRGDELSGTQHQQTIQIPKTATSYSPNPSDTTVYGSGTAKISGIFEATGDTIIGDVEFQDGLLYIRGGSATVTGTITGNGAIVAENDIIITGSMATTSDLAALVAGGDISINGNGVNTSRFQGLILAEGSFTARDSQVIGSVISLDQNGTVELERVRAVNAKNLKKIDLNIAVELKTAVESNLGGGGSGTTGSGNPIGILYDGDFVELSRERYADLEDLAMQISLDGGSAAGEVIVRTAGGDIVVDLSNPGALPEVIRTAAGNALTSWQAYEGQVKTDSIVYEDIFQLDFNEFLQGQGGFRQLYFNSTPLQN